MFEVEFYTLPNGRKPVEEFLDSLNANMNAKAVASILILEQKGNTLRGPYSKYISGGLYELRIRYASDISRIFYFFFYGSKIILTNGFIKKTRKTPIREIKLAKKYKADYESRNTNE